MLRTPKLVFWICLIGCSWATCGTMTRAAETAVGDGPRITDCRIGFDNRFKVGFWTPIFVDVSGAAGDKQLALEATTCDNDGIATTTTTFVESEASTATTTMQLYIKVGRMHGPIQIKLVGGEETPYRAELQTLSLADSSHLASLKATSELILQLGSAQIGLNQAFPEPTSSAESVDRHVAQVDRVDRLPTAWYGYEAVDVVVVPTVDPEFCRQLAADRRRFAAIERWLDLGGRLVLCCGRNAPQLIGESGPLASLVPGKYEELLRLPQTRSLESFIESAAPIGKPGATLAIATPRLSEVTGHVDVFGRGSELPVVVRAPHGFGELTFVGLDLDQLPLADWEGRNAFWRVLLRPYLSARQQNNRPKQLTSLGYNDLSGALRQQLGRAFTAVVTISFPLVAALILVYLCLIGPVDYILIHRILRRPVLAWTSFPLILLLSCCGAAELNRWSKGDQSHINQIELVDFDAAAGSARAFYWSTLYSPNAARRDLALQPRLPDDKPAHSADILLSWFGLTGSGLGGMEAAGTLLDVARIGYQVTPQLNALDGVPILSASTKSFVATWTAAAPAPCSAALSTDDNGLTSGTVTNETGARLLDAYLLSGQWGYRLGNIEPGRQVEVSSALALVRVKTLLTRRAQRTASTQTDEHAVFSPDQATPQELLETLMFYDALGGEAFVGLADRYQANCDLSRLLDLGRAILVATADGPGSQLVDRDTTATLASSDDPSIVMYRVVLSVSPQSRPPTADH
jgi:hypothetical protein